MGSTAWSLQSQRGYATEVECTMERLPGMFFGASFYTGAKESRPQVVTFSLCLSTDPVITLPPSPNGSELYQKGCPEAGAFGIASTAPENSLITPN